MTPNLPHPPCPGEGTLIVNVWFPFPWPPPELLTVYRGEHEGISLLIVARTDGRLAFTTSDATGAVVASVVSQPIVVIGIYPAMLAATWTPSKCTLQINQHPLLPDLPGIQALTVLPPKDRPVLLSLDDPLAVTCCQKWIGNRKSKFSGVQTPRHDRRLKNIEEEADDLRNSISRLQEFQQQTLAGKNYLLGTLAGEMRAVVYWPPRRGALPDDNWNPLLLRMASKADLPLPVYHIPDAVETPLQKEAVVHLIPNKVRIERVYARDQLCDLQEALTNTAVRIGSAATGRTINAVELIKELAHTAGAAHYDRDASEFVELMQKSFGFGYDQTTRFMCNTAVTLVSLSEWVLSQLKIRKLIG
jgi:hypothetical protein